MTCHNCGIEAKKFGKYRNGLERFRCVQCGKTFTEARERPFDAMIIDPEKAMLALRMLVEGSSSDPSNALRTFTAILSLRPLILVGVRATDGQGHRERESG